MSPGTCLLSFNRHHVRTRVPNIFIRVLFFSFKLNLLTYAFRLGPCFSQTQPSICSSILFSHQGLIFHTNAFILDKKLFSIPNGKKLIFFVVPPPTPPRKVSTILNAILNIFLNAITSWKGGGGSYVTT